MGTYFLLVARRSDEGSFDDAAEAIADLERRWSRFVPDSEVSILNRSPGVPVVVSPDTFAMIRAAVDASVATDGRFDPTVHDSMVSLGYDRTFDEVGVVAGRPHVAPGVSGIELDDVLHAVTLPPGVRVDLGGIGKGTAADLVSGMLMDRGAAGIAVSIGGDVRVRGESPSGTGWRFSCDDGDVRLPVLSDGGVCTSSSRRRRWNTANGVVHHVLDPATGTSTDAIIESVTVVGATAQQAEVLTKAAMVAGRGATELLAGFGVESHIRWSTAA